jgi:hypothetical protein
LTSWVVCNDYKIHDIMERNVTIRSEISTMESVPEGFGILKSV